MKYFLKFKKIKIIVMNNLYLNCNFIVSIIIFKVIEEFY